MNPYIHKVKYDKCEPMGIKSWYQERLKIVQ